MRRVTAQNGFTLVELLVVITIIVIVTAAIVPSFSGYIRNQGVIQAQEQLKSDLRTVQNKSLTGSLSDSLIGANPVQYWGVRFTTADRTKYEYFISDTTTCPAAAIIPANQLQGFANLPVNIEAKISANVCMFFSFVNGDVVSGFPGNQIIIGYKNSTASGDCRRLIFNANGLIYSSKSLLCT